MKARESVGIHGRFTFTVYNADGSVADERVAENIMCVNGLTLLAQAINWSGVEDQNANMGNAFSTTYAAPVYGAIGTGNTAVADTDTQLTAEAYRSVVSAAATQPAAHSTAAQWTWQFFFGLPGSNVTVAECGVFIQGTSGTNTGSLLDHALISPTVTQTTAQTATLAVTFTIGN